MAEVPTPTTDETLSLEQRVIAVLNEAFDDGVATSVYGDDVCADMVIGLVREQIARDIEAELIPNARNVGPDAEHLNDGLRLAALRARGEAS